MTATVVPRRCRDCAQSVGAHRIRCQPCTAERIRTITAKETTR